MKQPKTTHFRNKFNENEQNYNGLGMSPRPTFQHQSLVFDFTCNVKRLITKNFVAAPEVELGEPNSPAPDVVVFNKKSKKPHFLIEIEHIGIKKTIEKTKKVIEQFPTLKECFIYDYKKEVFWKVTQNEATQTSISEFLGVDLKNELFQEFENLINKK